MLKEAAAENWKAPLEEITTEAGFVYHKNSGKKSGYGELASSASKMAVPTDVVLKEPKEFSIVGTSQKNVDGKNIVTGKPLFGLDVRHDGMLICNDCLSSCFWDETEIF